ncbi:hypothetical protein VZT92_025465 [Zoarces viviparus]|uniref:Uncharacterized protein n=1 Tax=Zoarces viviparus TaxID=48416 RepID=A0AAW1DX63_ZOAVI
MSSVRVHLTPPCPAAALPDDSHEACRGFDEGNAEIQELTRTFTTPYETCLLQTANWQRRTDLSRVDG